MRSKIEGKERCYTRTLAQALDQNEQVVFVTKISEGDDGVTVKSKVF